MKFIVMTNPAFGNNLVKEMILSGLIPEFIVTDSPYEISSNLSVTNSSKKMVKRLKFLKNRGANYKKFQPYFMAKKHGIKVIPSQKANTKYLEDKIKNEKIDYIFTFIFKILKPNIFNAPLKGSINFHPSNLPANRGATPWNWMVKQQSTDTKISFHYITNGVDSGAIIKQYDIPLPAILNSTILREYLFQLGSVYYIKLIFELKYNLLPTPKENVLSSGSYEPPFNRSDTKISIHQTENEITSTINASRDSFYNASFEFNKTIYPIVNYVELNEQILEYDKDITLDNDGNLIVRTSDNKYILLVTNKTNLKLK